MSYERSRAEVPVYRRERSRQFIVRLLPARGWWSDSTSSRTWPSRHYGAGALLQGLPAGLSGRTLLAGVCLAGDWLRLTPR